MVNSKFLNEKIAWALTPEAASCLNDLVTLGVDRDLALFMLERVLPETSLYALPDAEDV